VSGYVATDAAAYERSMGRWSRLLAERFLDACALGPGMAVLDAGCGTGALSEAIARRDATARIGGVDLGEAFVRSAQARVPGGLFRVGDVTRLDDPDAAFDAVLSLLVLQFVPDRAQALREMRRVTRPGGLVAAAMWNFGGGMPFLRVLMDTAAALLPGEGERFRADSCAEDIGAPGRLRALFAQAGLHATEQDIVIRQEFAGFDDWWEPWEAGQGTFGAFVMGLEPDPRARLRDAALRAFRAGAPDGPRSFVAVARMAMARLPG